MTSRLRVAHETEAHFVPWVFLTVVVELAIQAIGWEGPADLRALSAFSCVAAG